MRLKDEDLKEIARLVDEGWTRNQLAKKYNYSSGSIEKIIKRYKNTVYVK